MHRRRLRKIGIRLGPGSIGVVGEVVRSGKVKPGNRDDWYVKFTGRDANVMRSANAEFLKDCIERERCLPQEQKGNRKWSGRARLRNAPKPSKK